MASQQDRGILVTGFVCWYRLWDAVQSSEKKFRWTLSKNYFIEWIYLDVIERTFTLIFVHLYSRKCTILTLIHPSIICELLSFTGSWRAEDRGQETPWVGNQFLTGLTHLDGENMQTPHKRARILLTGRQQCSPLHHFCRPTVSTYSTW